MEHNLGLYGIGIRYILCLFSGMIGGLVYPTSFIIGFIFLSLTVVFFLEAILAFDPIVHFMGKGKAKEAVEDFN